MIVASFFGPPCIYTKATG